MIGVWHVAFERGRTIFGHVLAFAFDGAADVWVVVDPCMRVTDIRVMDRLAFDGWVLDLAGRADIYRVEVREQASILSPGLWCVGTIKRIVGLRSGALSPWGLRRDLLKAGATRVFLRNEAESDPRGPAGQARSAG